MKLKSVSASIAALSCVFALSIGVYAAVPQCASIRVYLTKLSSAPSIALSAPTGVLDVKLDTNSTSTGAVQVEPDGKLLNISLPGAAGKLTSSRCRVAPTQGSASVLIERQGGARSYAGTIDICARDGKLVVVNELTVEDYVNGVLPAEMPELYPFEALKAQAVVIRTYAMRNLSKHASVGADLCDETHCQSYQGMPQGRPRCARAVAETKGLILTYEGRPAHVQYCADGGGATVNYAALYNRTDLPYLCGVADPEGVAHRSWEATFRLADLEQRLVRAGIKNAAGLASLRVSDQSDTGRVTSVEVSGSTGSEQVRATRLRDALGVDTIKSTLFSLECGNDGIVTFRGRGYGHGIGLCQAGCKGLAQAPFNYTWDRLLSHYFPGTQVAGIDTLTDSPTARSEQSVEQFATAPPAKQPQASAPLPSSPPPDPKARPIMDLRLIAPDQL